MSNINTSNIKQTTFSDFNKVSKHLNRRINVSIF